MSRVDVLEAIKERLAVLEVDMAEAYDVSERDGNLVRAELDGVNWVYELLVGQS